MAEVMRRELAKQKKMLHPNSRKVLAIAKKSKKAKNRENSKQTGSIKQHLIKEKMLWMQENMIPNLCPYTADFTAELLEKYIARHDEELQWIAQKNKIPGKKNRSHANREDILRMTKEREQDEYNGCGIEIPNILNSTQCEMLRKWDGDVRYLPNFSFRRFGKRHADEVRPKMTRPDKNSKEMIDLPPVLTNMTKNEKNENEGSSTNNTSNMDIQ